MKSQKRSWELEQLVTYANLEPSNHKEEQEEGTARIRKWLALADSMLQTDLQ